MTTRRNMIKAGAGLAAILASGKAPAYFIKSMLAARNSIGMKSGGAKLPYDAEVEYLESTGTQYIDTGVFLSSDHMVSLRSLMTANNSMFGSVIGGQYFFGGQTGTGGSSYAVLFGNTSGRVDGTAHGNAYTVTVSKAGVTVDGVGTAQTLSGNFTCTATCGIFCRNSQAGGFTANDIARTGSRLYWFRIFDNGALIRDMIAVRFTNEQGVSEGSMYDRLGVGGMNPDGSPRTDGLYRNRGTGAFGYGNDN